MHYLESKVKVLFTIVHTGTVSLNIDIEY